MTDYARHDLSWSRGRRAGVSVRLPRRPRRAHGAHRGRRAPLYWRLLGLRRLRPNAWQRALLAEGVFAAAAVLVLADFASAWALLVLPLAVAFVVKGNDMLAVALARPGFRPPAAPPFAGLISSPHGRHRREARHRSVRLGRGGGLRRRGGRPTGGGGRVSSSGGRLGQGGGRVSPSGVRPGRVSVRLRRNSSPRAAEALVSRDE